MELPAIVVGFSLAGLARFVQEAPQGAIILKLVPPKSELETLSEILLKSLGLSGALALTGLVLGVTIGAIVFLVRYRSARDAPSAPDITAGLPWRHP
jgi:hypothetical protein